MSEQPWVVTALSVFPTKGEPGEDLTRAVVTEAGLLGDRHKRHALLVAGTEDVATTNAHGEQLRANIVVTMPSAALAASSGRELRIGGARVRIDRRPSACEGMYAEVVEPGEVAVGDACLPAG